MMNDSSILLESGTNELEIVELLHQGRVHVVEMGNIPYSPQNRAQQGRLLVRKNQVVAASGQAEERLPEHERRNTNA